MLSQICIYLQLWAEVQSTKMTNDSAESFHAHFNAQFDSAHPTIFVFTNVLHKLQTTTNLKLRNIDQPVAGRKDNRTRKEFAIMQSLGYRFVARMDM